MEVETIDLQALKDANILKGSIKKAKVILSGSIKKSVTLKALALQKGQGQRLKPLAGK